MPDRARPSPHLSWAEMACKDGTPYPAEWHDRANEIALMFEEFRAFIGGWRLTVGSVYRTPAHNRKIGGAANSWHVQGLAIDLHKPDAYTIDSFHAKALVFWRDGHCNGLGLYPWGVHLDLRTTARAKWASGHPKDSVYA